MVHLITHVHNLQPAGKTDKAKLISRMAKMGQPMLPMTGAARSPSESEDPEVSS